MVPEQTQEVVSPWATSQKRPKSSVFSQAVCHVAQLWRDKDSQFRPAAGVDGWPREAKGWGPNHLKHQILLRDTFGAFGHAHLACQSGAALRQHDKLDSVIRRQLTERPLLVKVQPVSPEQVVERALTRKEGCNISCSMGHFSILLPRSLTGWAARFAQPCESVRTP